MAEMREISKPRRSSGLWYLAPVILGVLGGFAAFFANKDEDRRLAKRLMAVGLIQTIIVILVPMALGAWQAYKYRVRLTELKTLGGDVSGAAEGDQTLSGIARALGALGSVGVPIFLPPDQVQEAPPSPIQPESMDCTGPTVKVRLANMTDAEVPVEALSEIEMLINNQKASCRWSGPLARRGYTVCTSDIPARPDNYAEVKLRFGAFGPGMSGICTAFPTESQP